MDQYYSFNHLAISFANEEDAENSTFKQISASSGRNDEEELDINFNHNVNYEPLANEGCGCTGSYNGGAGAGTAACGSGLSNIYETGLVNKKPGCGDEYNSGPTSQFRTSPFPVREVSYFGSLPLKEPCSPYDANTYQIPSTSSRYPICMDHYVPEGAQGNSYGGPDTYELIRNTDAQRYKGRGPDRSEYYSDDY